MKTLSLSDAVQTLHNWAQADRITAPGPGVQTKLGSAIEVVLASISDSERLRSALKLIRDNPSVGDDAAEESLRPAHIAASALASEVHEEGDALG